MRKILSAIYGADPRMQKTRKRFSMGSVASFVAGVAQVDVGATLPDGTKVYMAIPAAQGLTPSVGGVAAIQYANENLHGGYITAIGQSAGVQSASDADTLDGHHASYFGLAVVTKTDTGEPAGSEGLFCINTFDNTFKVYADGAWRSLAAW